MEQSLTNMPRSEASPEERRQHAHRKQRAFLAGDSARDQSTISPEAHMLYEYLLRYASCKSFCWPGQAHLASILKCSISTVKRRTRELTDAGLIRRERRLNRSSLTFIVAYCPDEYDDQAGDAPGAHQDDVPEPGAMSPDLTTLVTNKRVPVADFAPSYPASGPTVGSSVSPHTINSQNPENKGGGSDTNTKMLVENKTVQALQHVGVVDQSVLHELCDRPIQEVERTIRYAAECRGDDDPRRPGLIVHLLRSGFGKRPCKSGDVGTRQTRSHRKRSGSRPVASTAGDPHRYMSEDFCRHGVYGACPACRTSTETVALPEDVADPPEQGAASSVVAAPILGCWPSVLARLAQDIAPDEFSIWLSTTTLLDIIDGEAIIGTPNVFVRNQVRDIYGTQLMEALAAELGHAVQVEVVVDAPVLA